MTSDVARSYGEAQRVASPARRVVRRLWSVASFLSVVAPGMAGRACLWLARDLPQFAWVADVRQAPWQFWAALVAGAFGTTAGVLDWAYHRWSGVRVTGRERRVELL